MSVDLPPEIPGYVDTEFKDVPLNVPIVQRRVPVLAEEYSIPPPRTYVFEPIRTYGTFDLTLTENATETTKFRDRKISFVGFSPSTGIFKDGHYLQKKRRKVPVLGNGVYCNESLFN